jgi:spore coat polysaccharide biosynthesis protein SpsF
MKIGIIVLCRYDSKRLQGKILKVIQGKTILSHIIHKLQKANVPADIVVATSTRPSDHAIVEHCSELEVPCFQGDLENVAERFLHCAQEHRFDYAVRINGDNLFTDPVMLDQMLVQLEMEKYDFISNVPERTFPYGMSVEVLQTEFFASILPQFKLKKYKEHVTLYLYEHEGYGKRHYFYNKVCPGLKGINLAIDTTDDFKLAEKIYTRLSHLNGYFGLKELCLIKDFIIHERMER